ncbi:MAG: AI-2E family transporter [Burkholderiales bacterium]
MDIQYPNQLDAPAFNVRLTRAWVCGALIVVLSVWILKSFLLPVLVACVTAIASWPLYRRCAEFMPPRLPRSTAALVSTAFVTAFVLAPLTYAFAALTSEAHALLVAVAAADKQGIAVPHWVERLPLAGWWLADRWQTQFAHPGALLLWAQRADTTPLLGWAQSLGRFMAREVFIIVFTILVLFFLYQHGEALAQQFRRLVRHRIGEQTEATLDVATRALRASANSIFVVGLFDGLASGIAYAAAGVPHAATWAAITGSLALVPFLGYVAVVLLTLQLAIAGAGSAAPLSFWLGCVVLLCGDKIIRPAVAREGTHLSFVWVLMGCLGGFEVLGLVGLVIGPVVLTLARELWQQRVRDVAPQKPT